MYNNNYKGGRKPSVLPKALRPEEFPTLIKALSDKQKDTKVAFLLAYGSGLRIAEVCNLKKNDLANDRIYIYEGKGGKDRIVPLPKGWRKWMDSHIPIKVSYRTLQRHFEKATAKCKLNPKYTFHSLRHGFATRLIEKGVPLNQVQVLLGHTNVSTTNVYIKANPRDALTSYEELF